MGYEEDIHVPLIVRGPGVKQGHRDTVSSYGIVDLSRTILDVAGAKTPYVNDGVRINLHQEDKKEETHQLARHSISEYWVLGVEEGVWGGKLRENNSECGWLTERSPGLMIQQLIALSAFTMKFTANPSPTRTRYGVQASESCMT